MREEWGAPNMNQLQPMWGVAEDGSDGDGSDEGAGAYQPVRVRFEADLR
jgi:hypothetical protein